VKPILSWAPGNDSRAVFEMTELTPNFNRMARAGTNGATKSDPANNFVTNGVGSLLSFERILSARFRKHGLDSLVDSGNSFVAGIQKCLNS